jgi:molybdenum cofactor cytidylyltransferase
VAGETVDQVTQALSDLPVQVIFNSAWQSGQSSSIRAGLKALPASTGAAIFLLVDQPQIPAALLRAMVEEHAAGLPPVLAPLAGGRRANPVLFDRLTFPDLLQISGDQGGRAVFSKYQVSYLPWHDEQILLDVDTPQDYDRLLRWNEP